MEDRAALDAVLDEGLVCHVGFVQEGQPYVVPTGYVRDGDRILLHGSRASRLMQHLASGAPVCITVTLLDGLVLARSAFHHSMNYRSAVLFGSASPVPPEETDRVLRTYMDRLVPGQWDVARRPNAKELAGTLAVWFPIQEWSVKSRAGPPGDEPEDLGFPSWSGVLPLRLAVDEPRQDPTQEAANPPAHVAAWRPDRRR